MGKVKKSARVKKPTKLELHFPNVYSGYSNIFEYAKFDGKETNRYTLDLALDDEQVEILAEDIQEEFGKEGLALLKKKFTKYEKNPKDAEKKEINLTEYQFLRTAKTKFPIELLKSNRDKIDVENTQGYLETASKIEVVFSASIYKGEVGNQKTYVESLVLTPLLVRLRIDDELKKSSHKKAKGEGRLLNLLVDEEVQSEEDSSSKTVRKNKTKQAKKEPVETAETTGDDWEQFAKSLK